MSNFFVHPSAFVDEECVIGEGVKIWHFCHIMSHSVIGKNCSLGQNVVVSPRVKLGSNVKVQNNVLLVTGVTCEDDVFIGPSVTFTNVLNPRSAIVRRGQYSETLVKRGASIGGNVTIVCGNTIGQFAFIGAGAVVTKSVPDYALVMGNPARQTGWMSEFGHKLKFDDEGKAICPESGEVYFLKDGTITKLN